MTDNPPVFSIVIPAYNYANTLQRAVESVLRQPGDDYEILVVDDGSTDNTKEVLSNLQRRYAERFQFVSRPNCGAAASRNFGIANTSGSWLIFLDSDDELEPDALEKLRVALAGDTSARMIVGGHISVETDGRERYRGVDVKGCSSLSQVDMFTGYILKKSITPSNGATAMHRDIFDRVRYPESFRNSEDIPVFACALANFPCTFIDQSINRIYKHSDSLRHNLSYADAVGEQLIDAVFDPGCIPADLQAFKKLYASQRCLSLFRTFCLAGDKQRALHYYRKALKYHWPSVFNFSYTKKAVRCLISW